MRRFSARLKLFCSNIFEGRAQTCRTRRFQARLGPVRTGVNFAMSQLIMNRWSAFFLVVLTLLAPGAGRAETEPFKFVFMSDIHVGGYNGEADLRKSVRDINNNFKDYK